MGLLLLHHGGRVIAASHARNSAAAGPGTLPRPASAKSMTHGTQTHAYAAIRMIYRDHRASSLPGRTEPDRRTKFSR